MNKFNLFVKANRAAFNSLGHKGDTELLHFLTSPLPLPNLIRVEVNTENPQSIALSLTDQLADRTHFI